MKFGVVIPNVGTLASNETLMEISHTSEQLGFDGIFVNDHVIVPADITSHYPYRSNGVFPISHTDNIFDPIVTLSYLAATTRTIKLGFSVLILPYRQPILNAKMLSTLDVLSNGRLIVGAGVGWMEEEFNLLEANYVGRANETDHHIAQLKDLWGCDPIDIPDIGTVSMHPKPTSRPRPPIWTGGITKKALRRAAMYADGWHGIRLTPSELESLSNDLLGLRAKHHNNTDNFVVSMRSVFEITDSQQSINRIPLRGSTEQIQQDIQTYHRSGLQYLMIEPRGNSLNELQTQISRFMNEIIEKLDL